MTPLVDLLNSALSCVQDRKLPRFQRVKWARVSMCAFAELPRSEHLTAAVLLTATTCLNQPAIIRILVMGVWGVYGVDPRVTAWTSKLVEGARARCQAPTVVALMELLVQMEHFTGELPAETVDVLLEAAADQRCHVGLFDLAWYHDQRFKPAGSVWVRQILDDPRVLEGARHIPRSTCRVCPACQVTPVWASGLMARARKRPR